MFAEESSSCENHRLQSNIEACAVGEILHVDPIIQVCNDVVLIAEEEES